MNQQTPSDHYTAEDKARLTPLKEKVKAALLNRGWVDLDVVAAELGMRVGTLASRLRELKNPSAGYTGLSYERKNLGGGKHIYRLYEMKPEQMPLFKEM